MSLVSAVLGRRREADAATIATRREEIARKRFKASPAMRLVMWRELASLLEQFSLPDALEIIRLGHSENNKRPNDLIAMVAETWIPRIRGNQSLADVTAGAVGDRERLMIAVAENSASFPDVLRRVHHAERILFEVKDRWRASIREPLGLIAWSWAMLVGYAYMVVWQTAQFPTPPRGWAKIAGDLSSGMFYWVSWIVPAIFLSIALSLYLALRFWLSPTRSRWERMWPFSLWKAQHAADFLMALSILTLAGQDVAAALRSMSQTASKYMRWHIDKIEPKARVQDIGQAVADAGDGFPDTLINSLLAVFSQDPKTFPDHLVRITDEYTDQLVHRMEISRKNTNILALAFAGFLQILNTLLMLASSLV
jgi:type II secretory pathway component PulF